MELAASLWTPATLGRRRGLNAASRDLCLARVYSHPGVNVMSNAFKDHFSRQAAEYARRRPTYPPELFAWLSSLVNVHDAAWDCGAGNGQAAIGLADHFTRVIATEPSANQLAHAAAHPRVEYRCESAESSSIAATSVSLITAAQAAHWFDLDRFYAEVRRVALPGGVLAIWCYHLLNVDPLIDPMLLHYYGNTVGPYWPFDRRLVEDGYQTLPFPFSEIAPPSFVMTASWDRDDLLGYLHTWSATQRFMAERGHDPLADLDRELLPYWPAGERKVVRWPLKMRVGRI